VGYVKLPALPPSVSHCLLHLKRVPSSLSSLRVETRLATSLNVNYFSHYCKRLHTQYIRTYGYYIAQVCIYSNMQRTQRCAVYLSIFVHQRRLFIPRVVRICGWRQKKRSHSKIIAHCLSLDVNNDIVQRQAGEIV
jgi:hypothetical protein